MDLAYSKEHIDTFVIVSGDSDFSPLVSKLKENGKHVIGLGMQESTSDLLRDNCDEFIYYEDLGQAPTLAPTIRLAAAGDQAQGVRPAAGVAAGPAPREQGSAVVVDGQGHDEAQEAVVQRGLSRLPHLQRAAGGRQKEGLLELDTDKRSRTYVVTRFGSEMKAPSPESPEATRKKSRRRRGSGGKKELLQPATGEVATTTIEAPVDEPNPIDLSPIRRVTQHRRPSRCL